MIYQFSVEITIPSRSSPVATLPILMGNVVLWLARAHRQRSYERPCLTEYQVVSSLGGVESERRGL